MTQSSPRLPEPSGASGHISNAARETTEKLLALDRAHLWHPFTQMQAWPDDDPIVVERADGNYLVDTLGRRFFDGISSLWTNVHGHNVPALNAAVAEQLKRVAHSTLLGQASVTSIQLATRIAQLTPPDLSKVFFSDSGSTAVEVALKMAYQYWRHRGEPQRRRFAALNNAYHGDTVGSVSLGGIELFHECFKDLLFPVVRLPSPHPYRWNGSRPLEESLSQTADILAQHRHELAAVVVEPLVQGAAGIVVHPKGYLAGLAKLCRRFDILLICDEVATGFGKTGTLFAIEQESVVPDFLCLAKGLSGGYLPLAATVTTNRVYEAFLGAPHEAKTFFHGHTYTGNALACAAALANLELLTQPTMLPNVRANSATLAELLEPLRNLSSVGDVRICGLMAGVELVADKATKTSHAASLRTGFQVCRKARDFGVLLRPLGDVVVLMPPLSATNDELVACVAALRRAIELVCGP